VEPGEHVRCTFVNKKQVGRITIIKDAVPDSPQDFDFEGDLGHFTLDDDADATLPDRIVRDHLTPGTYTVTETLPPGWRLTRVNCDGVEFPGPSIDIQLEAHDDITCVFSNVQLGTVTIVKDFIPPSTGPSRCLGTPASTCWMRAFCPIRTLTATTSAVRSSWDSNSNR
jgi:hypothetical protein